MKKLTNIGIALGITLFVLAIWAASASAQMAQTAKPAPSGIARLSFLGQWQYLVVNALIIFAVLFVAQSALLPKKEGREKSVIWMIALVASVVASWFISSNGFIWQMPFFAKYLRLKMIVNTILLSAALWFGIGLLDINIGDKKEKKIGIALIAILVSVMIASNIGDKWLWSHDTVKFIYDYLLGDEKTLGYTKKRVADYTTQKQYIWFGKESSKITGYHDEKGDPITVGGILTLKEPNYRLITFVVSLIVIGWFFTSFLDLKNQKLTWAIVIIMAANLTRRGTPLSVVVALGEAFLILIIGKQIKVGSGAIGTIFSWLITIGIVEFIFCTVFGESAIASFLTKSFSSLSQVSFIGKLFPTLTSICSIVPGGGKGSIFGQGGIGGGGGDGLGDTQTPPEGLSPVEQGQSSAKKIVGSAIIWLIVGAIVAAAIYFWARR